MRKTKDKFVTLHRCAVATHTGAGWFRIRAATIAATKEDAIQAFDALPDWIEPEKFSELEKQNRVRVVRVKIVADDGKRGRG